MKVATVVAVMAFTAAQAAAVAEADPRWRYQWSSCGAPGITCAKTKRAALAVAEALAEASPRWRYPWSSCGAPGITCAKARRSLEELGSATEKTLNNVLSIDKDEAAIHHKNKLFHSDFPSVHHAKRDAEAAPRWRYPWSSCGAPGITCAKAKRGAELIAQDFPNMHRDECFAEGGECHTVLKARAAFDEAVKREAEPRWRYAWSSCGAPGITCARDVLEHAKEKANGNPAADKAEEECYGPDGDCTKADAYFAELDAALTKATDEVLKLN